MQRLSLILCLLVLARCTPEKKQQQPKGPATIKPIKRLSGSVFRFAPEIDREACEAFGECDCCYSDMVFTDNSRFIYIAYCVDKNDYFTGTYRLTSKNMAVRFDSLYISNETQYLEGTETSTDTLKRDYYQIKSETLPFMSCGNKTGFKGLDGYGFEDPGKFSERMKELRDLGVLGMMGE